MDPVGRAQLVRVRAKCRQCAQGSDRVKSLLACSWVGSNWRRVRCRGGRTNPRGRALWELVPRGPWWEVLRMRQAGAPGLRLVIHANFQAEAPGKGRQTANHHGCLRHHSPRNRLQKTSMPGQERGRPACCPPPLGRPAGRVNRRIWVAPLVHNPTNGRGPEKLTRPLPKAQPRPPCRLGRV